MIRTIDKMIQELTTTLDLFADPVPAEYRLLAEARLNLIEAKFFINERNVDLSHAAGVAAIAQACKIGA